MISKNIDSGYTDEYTRKFLPTAEHLVAEADKVASSDPKQASDLYLRACTVYRIARFPYINSPYKTKIYEAQKQTYIKAASSWECPIKDVVIPHTAGTSADKDSVPLYVRLPKGASKSNPCPAVLLMCGLDGHRPDNTTRSDEFLARGWASIIADIPGTADCPADRRDPKSADRLWTSVLDWMVEEGTFDMKRVIAWGLSAGGYNAVSVQATSVTSGLLSIAARAKLGCCKAQRTRLDSAHLLRETWMILRRHSSLSMPSGVPHHIPLVV